MTSPAGVVCGAMGHCTTGGWLGNGPIRESSSDPATETVAVPSSLLHRMSEVALGFEAFQDALEDYLLSQDPAFLEQMRHGPSASPGGETRPLDDLKRELCTGRVHILH